MSPEPFDCVEDAILFAMSLPQSGRFCIEIPGQGRATIANGKVERVIPPFNPKKPSPSPKLPVFVSNRD